VVRVKVACKDFKGMPIERLFEMNKKLYMISL